MTDMADIEADMARIVRRGYGAAPEETMLGINAVAAPVFDATDSCVASIALVGSIQFLPANPSASLLKNLKACAHEISRRLGHGGQSKLMPEPSESRVRPAQRTTKKRAAR
jgi:DNA-binding IclR family transcriptional regulator